MRLGPCPPCYPRRWRRGKAVEVRPAGNDRTAHRPRDGRSRRAGRALSHPDVRERASESRRRRPREAWRGPRHGARELVVLAACRGERLPLLAPRRRRHAARASVCDRVDDARRRRSHARRDRDPGEAVAHVDGGARHPLARERGAESQPGHGRRNGRVSLLVRCGSRAESHERTPHRPEFRGSRTRDRRRALQTAIAACHTARR